MPSSTSHIYARGYDFSNNIFVHGYLFLTAIWFRIFYIVLLVFSINIFDSILSTETGLLITNWIGSTYCWSWCWLLLFKKLSRHPYNYKDVCVLSENFGIWIDGLRVIKNFQYVDHPAIIMKLSLSLPLAEFSILHRSCSFLCRMDLNLDAASLPSVYPSLIHPKSIKYTPRWYIIRYFFVVFRRCSSDVM